MKRPGSDSDAQLLLRLPQELKTALQRAATIEGRTLTAEANLRLQKSFDGPERYIQTNLGSAHLLKDALRDNSAQNTWPTSDLSDTDRAMLSIFRRMPPEKQLALLSLFK